MCGQWGESGVTKSKSGDTLKAELSLPELTRLVDEISRFRPNITLFGGEPLLHPHCLALIRMIKAKKMHCLMITNGSLLSAQSEALVESGLDELNVSLDGGRDLHDHIRGMPGIFEKIIAGLKAVQQYKKNKSAAKPLINLQCTITKYNYEQLSQLTEVAADIKADSLTFHNLIFLDKDLIARQKVCDEQLGCSSQDWEGFVSAPDIDPEKLYQAMGQIKSKPYPFPIDFYPNLSRKGVREYYTNPSYMPAEYPKRCLSPWIVAYVFPDGSVRPCLNSTYTFGTIKDAPMAQIWNSDQAIRFRRALKCNGLFPVCVRCTELYRY
jgi:Predicted Fe-S oxidoreductases